MEFGRPLVGAGAFQQRGHLIGSSAANQQTGQQAVGHLAGQFAPHPQAAPRRGGRHRPPQRGQRRSVVARATVNLGHPVARLPHEAQPVGAPQGLSLRAGQLQRALEVADCFLIGEVAEGVFARVAIIIAGSRRVAGQPPMVG